MTAMPVSAMTPVNSVSKIKGVTQLPLDMQHTLAWLPAFRQLTPFPHSFTTLLEECNLLVDQLWPSQLPILVSASSPDALHPPVRTGINLSQMSQLHYNNCSEDHTMHVCKVPHDVAIPTPLFADSHACLPWTLPFPSQSHYCWQFPTQTFPNRYISRTV